MSMWAHVDKQSHGLLLTDTVATYLKPTNLYSELSSFLLSKMQYDIYCKGKVVLICIEMCYTEWIISSYWAKSTSFFLHFASWKYDSFMRLWFLGKRMGKDMGMWDVLVLAGTSIHALK